LAREYRVGFGAMASRCEVCVCARDADRAQAWAAAAIAEVHRIEAKYSRYRDDSVIAHINRAAGAAPVEVDAETAALIGFAASLYVQSEGRFDVTSGVLRRAWDFRAARVPAARELEALLPLVGWDKAQWDPPHLRLALPGMEIDFGGIGKEYAADRAAAVLAECGARHGFVNLGGDVRAFGPAPDGSPWRIGIRHPRTQDALLGSIELTDGAVATSGDYERCFDAGGRRYCHILDPRTGWPAQHWQSVSVAAPACAAAGACATIVMLATRDAGLAFLRVQGVDFLAVTSAGEVLRA
jgi:thiamine biosynthesis lipoprotein